MVPVIAAGKSSPPWVRKQKTKDDSRSSTSRFSLLRRPSTAKTQKTDVQPGEPNPDLPKPTVQHQRDLSLTVGFDPRRAAQQLRAGNVSDLDLALFALWIRTETDNYTKAKELVRELALDQVYTQTYSRIEG